MLLLLAALCLNPLSSRLAAGQTAAPVVAAEPYAAARANARKITNDLSARGIPGIAVAVAVDGHLVYAEGFGYADLEERVPVSPITKFRIGSISKTFTAVALVQLVEQGKVDLDAPVQKYVPSFPDKGAEITPRMLGGHLAGIRHYKGDEFLISQHYDSVLDSLKIFENDPLVAPPGTAFHYSSYGFNLLSAVIESASGEKFIPYLREHVWTPLGLIDTTSDENRFIIEQRSRFYDRADSGNGPTENAPYVDNSYKWAGGGLLSTAEDMVRFGSALLHPGFLTEDSLHLLFKSQKTMAGRETGYGIGWFIHQSKSGQRIYEHSGGSVGGTTQLIIYPDSRIVIAFLTNLSEAPWKIGDVEAIAEPFAGK
jgi:serine beta-lactamase-like protein LACTB, mitochondrial